VVGVQDIDLAISSGELLVLKGNSGSGKSTLLSLLGGLDRPTGGRLVVNGRDLRGATHGELNRYRRDVVGMVFQSFNLLPTLTVLENVCLPGMLAGRKFAELQDQATQRLEWLDMGDRRNHYPGELSGGEMQRTAIVRALINEPAIILADEPTGNLDSGNGQLVMELLARLNRDLDRTVIIATHSQLADPYAHRQICLKDGAITEIAACTA
jgi:ABC-type lipoprotein export system ATPase subunit